MNGRGWGGPTDAIGRGGSPPLGLEGEGLNGSCPDIANADDVDTAGGLDGVAMADDASGGDTCRVDGGVMYGVDKGWGEAGPVDAEAPDVLFVDGDADRLLDNDSGPADIFGGIAELDTKVCVGANNFDEDRNAGGDNHGVADTETEGAMGSGVEIGSKGDVKIDFERFAAAVRTFSRSSCRISSALRAFGESLSSEFLLEFSASCLFVYLSNSSRGLMVFKDPFWSSALAKCFV